MIDLFFPSQIVEYIDIKFPHAKSPCGNQDEQQPPIGQEYGPVLSFLLIMMKNIPPHVLMLRGDNFAEFGEAMEAIRMAVNAWNRRDKSYTLQRIPGRRRWCPIVLIRKQLSALSDEGIAPATTDLLFISDPQYRELLRRDITAANSALDNGGWKAATVLAGSVIEAILLDAVKVFETKNPDKIFAEIHNLESAKKVTGSIPDDLDKWNLHYLIEVALVLNLITDPTASECRIAKDFRNLVHPGREVRKGQTCDRGTALSAIAAMEHVIRNLTKP